MALIVPNATATGSGKKYLNINQAEPDSVDLESLGNSANYIRSGGAITVAASNSVTVATGVAVIGGVPYTFPASTVTDAPDATSPRFDLVVARLTAGSVSVVFITGTVDATNPTLPRSTTVVESGGSTANTYNPTTDALIASIYLPASTTLDTSANLGNIADKRIIDARPVTYTAASAPTATSKDVVGDMVIYGDDAYIRMTSVWIKMGESTDVEQAKIPIGVACSPLLVAPLHQHPLTRRITLNVMVRDSLRLPMRVYLAPLVIHSLTQVRVHTQPAVTSIYPTWWVTWELWVPSVLQLPHPAQREIAP